MAPKRRNKENRPLPKRWRYRCGTYSYMVPPGQEHHWDNKKEFKLGRSLTEAYRVWADRIGGIEVASMGELMDRYLLEVVPDKATGTQETDKLAIRRLRPVFGSMKPADIKPAHVYRYADLIKKTSGNKSTKNDVGTLRHILTKAVEWGLIDKNQLIGQVRLSNNPPRDRLVEDWEITEALSIESQYRGVQIAQPYIRLKLLTGLRRNDLLRLKLSDLQKDGIHVQPSKTRASSGKRLIFKWDDELRAVIETIKQIKPHRIGDSHLFTTRQGKPYIDERGKCNAFDSLWQRFMDKVMANTKVTDRFQERDLRAKVATDSNTLLEASERLGHSDTGITQRVYRRKPIVIEPLKRT